MSNSEGQIKKEENNKEKKNDFFSNLIDYKNSNKTQTAIADFACSLLLTIAIFMPFIVIKYGKRYYVDAKVIILYASAVILFLLLMLSNKVKVVKETKVALIFLGTICVSAMFSKFSSTALNGSIERREGVIMFFVYIILFIAASSFLSVNKRTTIALFSAGSIMSLYAVLQMYQIDPLQMYLYKKIVTPNTSIAAIGNSNFVSTYLCMFLIIAVALYIYKKSLIYLLFSGVLFLGFLAARTRGGWISFAVVCLIGLCFIIKSKERLIRAGIIVVTFLVLTVGLNIVTDNKIFDRAKISNILIKTENNTSESENSTQNQSDSNEASENKDNNQTESSQNNTNESQNSKANESESSKTDGNESNIKLQGSVSSRTNIMKVTFKAFLARPFLGEGPDTLGLRLKRDFYDEYQNHINLYNESIDKAHNEYLEYATSCGIFTLISYLTLAGMILYKLFKMRKDENSIVLLLGILMYLLQAFFNISVVMVAPLFWILLGFAVRHIYSNKQENEKEHIAS